MSQQTTETIALIVAIVATAILGLLLSELLFLPPIVTILGVGLLGIAGGLYRYR